jgi:hypothetical protein
MRTHRTLALAATLSIATTMVASDLSLGASAASAGTYASPSPDQLAALRSCEAGGDYGTSTGNGYYGAYQFSLETWQSLGYSGSPADADPAVQDEAATRLHTTAGWTPWPGCARRLGLTSRAPEVTAAAAAPSVAVPVAPPAETQAERDSRSAQRRAEREQRSVQRRRHATHRSPTKRLSHLRLSAG